MSNGRNVRQSNRPVGPNNINGGPSTNSVNPQQQLWKVLQFHETRLNNLEQMLDVILRALPWEARLEATDVEKYRKVENKLEGIEKDVEKYRKVENKLEGIEKEIENLKEGSVTSEVFNNVERDVERNVERNVGRNVERNVENVSISDESPEDYLRREELLEGYSMKSFVNRNTTKRGGRRVSLEVHE
tara:strand:- start:5573 stop:6136 length:564 start_codon:yes stop_codon:yes gene_type:complete